MPKGGYVVSSADQVAVVKSVYDNFGAGNVDAILEVLHDDVDWAGDADPPVSPWDGVRIGKDAVRQFFADLDSVAGGKDARFTPLAFGTSDNDEVFAFIRYEFKASTTGREAKMNLHHYWRFRGGKVEFFRGSEDTAQLKDVLGV
jgi:ketosteroid isomerase-like protein